VSDRVAVKRSSTADARSLSPAALPAGMRLRSPMARFRPRAATRSRHRLHVRPLFRGGQQYRKLLKGGLQSASMPVGTAAPEAAYCAAPLIRDEARELLAPVYGWFTEGFDTRDLREAKALPEELAS
jgi:hypothetical protein